MPLEQERVGDANSLLEEPAGIVAQVEHEAAQALAVQLRERAPHVLVGVVLEVLDRDVPDAVAQHPRLDRLDVDDGPHQLEHPRLREAAVAGAHDPYVDARTGSAAEPVDGLGQRHVERRLVADLHDPVAALEARARRGRVRHRTYDRELPVTDRDHDAEPAELAARAHAHLFVDVRREQHRVRVERAQHAVDGRVLDVAEVDVFVVVEVRLQEREDLAETVRERPGAVDVVDAEARAARR